MMSWGRLFLPLSLSVYIYDACNLISVSTVALQRLVVRFLTEPKLQSL